MGLFDKIKEPVFLKSGNQAENQIMKLKEIELLLNEEGKKIINQDIKYLEYGIAGEKSIAYELKNSHMPMYILQDIYLEDGDLGAQIDFLVFTKKLCFIIECKNLYGDIEINSKGDFIRTVDYGGGKKKEGIYSPITQNQRHLELMKKIRGDKNNNFFTKFIVDRYFENMYKSIVVLANAKTVLNDKYAKKEVKDKVIRIDQLVKYIKEMYNTSKEAASSEGDMLKWANTYIGFHSDMEKDYTAKYEKYKITSVKVTEEAKVESSIITKDQEENIIEANELTVHIEETQLFKELKEFRLSQSRKENIKPYFLFNDNQLKNLISKMPVTKEELLTVAGFGEVKVRKYGEEILGIVRRHR
ncbi:MAG: HRDC domain-containing protein [Clostridium sp.]